MTAHKLSTRRVALIGLPVAAAIVLGTAGFAFAAETPSAPSSSSSTATHGRQSDGDGGHADADKKLSYMSSVKTTATDDSANEAAADLALSKLATIDLASAAKAGAAALPGGVATDVSLDNESGNVVYTVEVTTGTQQTEVVIDAGNGAVLAKTVDNGD